MILGEITFDTNPDGGVVLGPAVPNPFNPATRINYYLPREDFVRIVVYDVSGRLVDELLSMRQSAGEHFIEWNAKDAPSGIYFYRLATGDFNQTRKMILVK